MQGYIDGFVLPVPKKNLRAYRQMSRGTGKIWRKHGALDYKECVGDDLSTPWGGVPFPKIVKPKKGETVVFAFIVYRSKAHRDRVNARVMKDPYILNPKWKKRRMPFDPKRMSYGGFKVIVDV